MLFLLLSSVCKVAYATHNRAGEITYKQIGQLTYEATLITYTDSKSVKADRPVIPLNWGDGQTSNISRLSQITLPNDIWKNTYTERHTYSGPGHYVLSFLDDNRVDGIVNMSGSVNVPFYVESLLIIDPQQGFVQSPVLLNPPIQVACYHKIFTDNPDAYDADGDSLYYTLIPPKQAVGTNVPGYTQPKLLTLNNFTGEVTWDTVVPVTGIYNIAILVQMFRNKKLIGYIDRDEQILVKDCNGSPPFIDPLHDTCIEAGINFNYNTTIVGRDTNNALYDSVKLTASGEPFIQADSPAVFIKNPSRGKDSVKSQFEWAVSCQYIREQPYNVIFKAIDRDSIADIKTMRVRVVGPEPRSLTATPTANRVILNWQIPICANPVGYFIYRRSDTSTWQHAPCEIGVPGYVGYKLIDTIRDGNTFTYSDDNRGAGLSPGIKYCYLVTAIYLNKGQFQFVEGYASNEACAELKKDLPVMTHASVRATSAVNGSMYVDWSKPMAEALDTNQNPGPYQYKLYRSQGIGTTNFTLVKISAPSDFHGLNDTTFIDTMLNTQGSAYTYRVEFYDTYTGNKFNLLGHTIPASSVFLTLGRAYRSIVLSWDLQVPWENTTYTIYRHNDSTQKWDSIGISKTSTFTDTGLVNGIRHCYYVKSTGSFRAVGFVNPIINFSEIMCSSARDTVTPCAPTLSGNADCDQKNTFLKWAIKDSCDSKVNRYKVYFSTGNSYKFFYIDSVNGLNLNNYLDQRQILNYSLAGCYYVTAIDSYDNVSRPSNYICVDNCPRYRLPNVFSPNGDEINDLFVPFPDYRFIQSIDLRVYNRWGQEVFNTSNPAINWDGTDENTHQKLPDGTYYYNCIVREIRFIGIVETPLSGTVSIVSRK